MVKFLLSLVVACVVAMPSVVAQTFEFRYQGQSLPDGATVTIAAELDDFDELSCETNPSSNPTNGLNLVLLSGTNANGTATLTIDENTMNPYLIQWCMGGTCSPMIVVSTITKPFEVNDGLEMVQFDAFNILEEGHLLATLTATIGGETHVVKIKFTNGEQATVPGDVNGDGKVTSVDITALYNYLLNDDSEAIVNGDQNGDGKITSVDVTVVYNLLLSDK